MTPIARQSQPAIVQSDSESRIRWECVVAPQQEWRSPTGVRATVAEVRPINGRPFDMNVILKTALGEVIATTASAMCQPHTCSKILCVNGAHGVKDWLRLVLPKKDEVVTKPMPSITDDDEDTWILEDADKTRVGLGPGPVRK